MDPKHGINIDFFASGVLSQRSMALLHEAVEAKKFDTRVIERNVQRGVITAQDAEKTKQQLSDDAENAEYVNIQDLMDEENTSSRSGSSS